MPLQIKPRARRMIPWAGRARSYKRWSLRGIERAASTFEHSVRSVFDGETPASRHLCDVPCDGYARIQAHHAQSTTLCRAAKISEMPSLSQISRCRLSIVEQTSIPRTKEKSNSESMHFRGNITSLVAMVMSHTGIR
jgi:hypothetical protein